MANVYDAKVLKAEKLTEAMLMLDTSRIIARGYAMLYQDNRVVESVQSIQKGQQATLQMRDGQLEVEVKDVKINKNI